MLLGCDHVDALRRSSNERINAAIPIAAPAQTARDALLELTNDAPQQGAEIERGLAARLEIRALDCGEGFDRPTGAG